MASPGSLHKDTLSGKHTSMGWRTDKSDAYTSLLNDHPSRTFVNSNFTRNPDHGLFSSPYNLKSAFQRVMAFFIDLMPKCCLLNVTAPFIKV